MREALAAAQAEFTSDIARGLLDFVAASERGLCADTAAAAAAGGGELPDQVEAE
jgi:hypothetical protein